MESSHLFDSQFSRRCAQGFALKKKQVTHRGLRLSDNIKHIHYVTRPKLPESGVLGSGNGAVSSILFLHAFGLSSEEFQSSWPQFTEANVLGVDLPCHGRSACWADVTPEDYEELFEVLLEQEKDFLGENTVLVENKLYYTGVVRIFAVAHEGCL